MPFTLGSATYLAPSLPIFFMPQHLFAGYGGLGRDRYFLVVCMTHLVPLVRLCTRFQYLRNIALDRFLEDALSLFLVAIIIFCLCT
jgi:hypothetical protein